MTSIYDYTSNEAGESATKPKDTDRQSHQLHLSNWDGLARFCEGGRYLIDSNHTRRGITKVQKLYAFTSAQYSLHK